MSKTFSGQRALDDVSLDIQEGEVHALIGHNGSGKSTLIKVLARYHDADPGAEITVLGRELTALPMYDGPLRFIHQDLGLVPTLNAVENLALGTRFARGRWGRIRWAEQRRQALLAVGGLGIAFDINMPVATLSPSERTTVAIARALHGMPRTGLLVLDEPTAALPSVEVDRLFEVIRAIAAQGSAVLFVSHRIDEVLRIADRVTVLRDGRVAATERAPSLDHDAVVELITGRPVEHHRPRAAVRRDDVVLEVVGLGGARLRDVSVRVHRGEIVGVAGITGSGREELVDLVFGARRPVKGRITVGGRLVTNPGPRRAIRDGMALVPADRDVRGLMMTHALRQNVTVARLDPVVRLGRICRRSERRDVESWMHRIAIAPAEAEQAVGTLSGGNRQKTLLARVLRLEAAALLLDEPTQGVDVGAKAGIHDVIATAAAAGGAVLLCTSDVDELAAVCDRVLVLHDGVVAAELSGDELAAETITAAGLRAEASAAGRNCREWA